MKLRHHIIATITISSVVYFVYSSVAAFISSVIGGILIDLDHVVDYYIHNGVNFKVRRFFHWCYTNQWKTLTIFFHSIELILILWLAVYIFNLGLFWLGFAIGVTQHMILDIIFNRKIINVIYYFFILRFIKKFKKEHIIYKAP